MSAPSSTAPTATKESVDLEEYDEEQVRLMEERCILVTPEDVAYGEDSKKTCHLMSSINGPSNLLHRAFSVFLFRPSDGALLLQKRADEKITFPGMWTNTCCSHPLSIKAELEEKGQMGVRRAAARKLDHELGIPVENSPPDAFTFLTRIHYLAPSDGLWGEHEIDYILFMTSPTEHLGNPNEVSDTRYVSKPELQAMFEDSANSFTPWFKLIARDFLFGWWDSLLERRDAETGLFDARAVEDLSDAKVWKM
ncbi:isopentenyl diphosphate isomerase [Mrakia frigida]|uniref:isopentenyl-diphosphate delta-isomerase IDI1 n=1 Tax=Mrakia frigida TaxID=29902 RepID=UPI003FCC1F2A